MDVLVTSEMPPTTRSVDIFTDVSVTNHTEVEDEAKLYLMYKIGISIEKYYFPLVFILGLVGNTISFFIFTMKHNRKNSCFWYMAILAISDTGLLISYFEFWLNAIILHSADQESCVVMTLFYNWFATNSICLIVCFTADRFLAICFPLKFQSVRSTRFARKMIIAILIVTLSCNVPHLFTSKLSESQTTCGTFGVSSTFTKIYSFIHLSIYSITPYILVFTMNVSIMKTIKTRTKTFGEMTSITKATPFENNAFVRSDKEVFTVSQSENSREPTTIKRIGSSNNSLSSASTASVRSSGVPNLAQYNQARAAEKQLVVMLMTVSFVFMILTLPLFVRYFIFTNIDYKASGWAYALYVLLYNLTNKLYMTNNAINFYIYYLSGRKFRGDCAKMFKCSSNSNRYSDTSSNS